MKLKLLEPLRELFKDEVRKLGVELGLPREMVYRHPFPGPGLGVRILGEVQSPMRICCAAPMRSSSRSCAATISTTRSARRSRCSCRCARSGVMGDGRRYDYVIALRAVETVDFMTARWARLPYEFLDRVALASSTRCPDFARRLRHFGQAAGDDRVGVIRPLEVDLLFTDRGDVVNGTSSRFHPAQAREHPRC
jgi:GMP synthase (glutamine-hydrolysing)